MIAIAHGSAPPESYIATKTNINPSPAVNVISRMRTMHIRAVNVISRKFPTFQLCVSNHLLLAVNHYSEICIKTCAHKFPTY